MKYHYLAITLIILLSAWRTYAQQEKEGYPAADTGSRPGKTLQDIIVRGQSGVTAARSQPFDITVIDTKKYYDRSAGAIDLLNQTAGVKVRQDGGLGSTANLYINGMAGKSIRFFIDGIPLEFLGSGVNLNILPVNIIDHIEVYKGAVPVRLGADALGGAVDIISRRLRSDYLDASYAISSFNTHRVSLNGHRHLGRLFYTEVAGFFNYSRNNYPVDVSVPDSLGRPAPVRVRRFHDQFRNYYASVSIGAGPFSRMDQLRFVTSVSGDYRQVQNNLIMTQPYAHVTNGHHSWNNALQFAKDGIGSCFGVDGYIGLNRIRGHFMDTSLNTYDWAGKAVARRSSGGETFGGREDLRIVTTNGIVCLNAHLDIDSTTRLVFNVTGGHYTRREDDTAAVRYPAGMSRMVTGIALEKKAFRRRLISISSIKYYAYSAKGYLLGISDQHMPAENRISHAGVNQALSWNFNGRMRLKMSYEYATRLPEDEELFGDYALIRPNPSLTPEVSHNANLGWRWESKKIKAELNGFFRRANNMVYLRTSQFYAQYQNLLSVQATGLEADLHYEVMPSLVWSLNATYQNMVNKSSARNSGATDNRYYGLRVPNIPFLFGNSELLYHRDGCFKKEDALSVWYTAAYTRWFYLYWSIDGRPDQKATIPTQLVQNSGVSYSLQHDRYAVSFEVMNLADAKVYDNYNLQLPGRSLHLKFRTFIQ